MAATAPDLAQLPFPGFAGGINLRDQPNQLDPTQAVDLLNVTFTDRGGIRSRDGYAKFTSSALTNQADSLGVYYTSTGTAHIIAGNGIRLDALSTAGASLANVATTASPHYFARFGGPATELLFISNGTDQVRQWNGAAFSTPTWTGTAPTGRFVAVTPWDNRLVNARRGGTTQGDNPSTVRFSDAVTTGAPLNWPANNFVDLEPGDGEAIQGIVSWLNYLFVFKETKFFVFYGTATSGTGTPIFNYRPMENGVGLAANRGLATSRDGVYFLSQRGVYRTSSTNAELVSPVLDPFFYGSTPDYFQLSQVLNQGSIANAAMTMHREQLYVAVPTGASTANNRLLVFDPRYGWWSVYDIPAAALASFKVSTQPDLLFAYATGTKDVGRHTTGQLTDAGTTIQSKWRSGWWDAGNQGVKVGRESLLWGKGSVQFGVRTDFGAVPNTMNLNFGSATDLWADGTNAADLWADGTSSTDLWGSGVTTAPQLNRQGFRGTVFSLELSNVDATAWAVYRAALHLMPINTGRIY